MVSLTNIRANIYTTVYNHIQTGSYALSTNNIHPSWNDRQQRSEGLPQVIIWNISTSENKITMGRNGIYEVPITFTISGHHNSAQNAQALADEITSKFRGAGRRVITASGIDHPSLDNDDYERTPWAQRHSNHVYHLNYIATYIGV